MINEFPDWMGEPARDLFRKMIQAIEEITDGQNTGTYPDWHVSAFVWTPRGVAHFSTDRDADVIRELGKSLLRIADTIDGHDVAGLEEYDLSPPKKH